MFDQNFFIGELPSAEQTSQFIPVSEFVFFVLLLGWLLSLLGLHCAELRRRGLLLLLIFLIVTVPSILTQEADQRVYHFRLEGEGQGLTPNSNSTYILGPVFWIF